MKTGIILTVLAAAALIAFPLYVVYTYIVAFAVPTLRNRIKAKKLGVDWTCSYKLGIFAVGYPDEKLSVTTHFKVKDIIKGTGSLTAMFDAGCAKLKEVRQQCAVPEQNDNSENSTEA